VVMAGKLEQRRVEAHVIALALEDDTFQIVVENGASNTQGLKARICPRRKLSSR
jgi:hypothetical protein